MEEYTEVIVKMEDQQTDVLMAFLAEQGFEMFEEQENALHAYIASAQFSEDQLKETLQSINGNLQYQLKKIEPENWNARWEKEYEPVWVEDKVLIRAPFHEPSTSAETEIIIEPKMSFGTGHHDTTRLVISMMIEESLNGQWVADFGCGTGVLAIYAEKAGAAEVLAIDNDDWSVENAIENVERNNCSKISVKKGTETALKGEFDTILANINRHILLQTMNTLAARLKHSGVLIVCGILIEDQEVIYSAASDAKLEPENTKSSNSWLSVKFKKT